jgi:hypothetical protein
MERLFVNEKKKKNGNKDGKSNSEGNKRKRK